MDHVAVIERLGGPSALAKLLGCHHSRPIRWRSEGIPRRRWPDILDIAEQRGEVAITLSALRSGERRAQQ